MRRPQTKVVYDDNSDEEDDNLSYRSDEDELLDDSPSDLEEEALGNDSDYVEELPDDDDGDDGSYCTESSFRSHSTLGSTPGTFICANLQTAFANRESGGFVFSLLQEPRRIVQNGACTQKRAFVYRVLDLPVLCRMDVSTGPLVFDLLSQKHI